MSSRSQTKSLDRDIQSQPKRKNHYLNIQQVNNAAEHLVCHLHNKIEHTFENYPVNRFDEELPANNISDYLTEISNKIDIDKVLLLKLKQLINTKVTPLTSNDPQELIVIYVDFILNCQNLFNGISNKLHHTINNGLLKYCISLARYCNSDIDFVINYEKLIQKNQADIIKEVKDIEIQYKQFKKFSSSSRTILYHVVDLVSSIRQIRASINKLYYFVTEWVDEERSYPSNLSEQLKLIKSEIFTLEEKTSRNDFLIKQRQIKIVNLEKQSKFLEKNYLTYRRKLNRIRNSQEQISTRLKEIETQTSSREDELKLIKSKVKSLEYLKHKPEKKVKIPHYKVSMEILATKTQQRDIEAKNLRLEDNKLALNRHQDRLLKVSEQLKDKRQTTKIKIEDNQTTTMKLKENLQGDIISQHRDIENLKSLQIKLKDINFINGKKNSPDTLRQIRNHGKLSCDSKDLNLTDRLCDLLSKRVLHNWKELYINLPMFPERTTEQRFHDIEIIDVISARNDSTPKKQTRMCLDKWRLFYHNATPEHLIEALQKSNNREVAKELEEETLKSKNRFEEEELIQDDAPRL